MVASLSAIFVVIGFGLMIWGLQQHHQVMVVVEDAAQISLPSVRLLTALTIFLQLALVVALVLFLLA